MLAQDAIEYEGRGYPMKTNVLGITFALAVTGGLLALTASAVADGSKLQSANRSNVYAMKMDRCPYYPSPVVCRDGSRAHTTSGGLTSAQAAVDVEGGKIM
jgi:hypothetical protein